jgi:DNA-binding winged helix-turn-helix (wHTH) protein/Tol biopolymer transport system component
MDTWAPEPARLRFGVFELELQTGELRRSGVLLHMAPQPFKVLALLASRPGQLVTREEIRDQIWGRETFVDFEHGLNVAIKEIRVTLGDNAAAPRYIETLPRRGYRFLVRVDVIAGRTSAPAETAARSGSRFMPSAEVHTAPVDAELELNGSSILRFGSPAAIAHVEMPIAYVTARHVRRRMAVYWVALILLMAAAVLVWYRSQPLPAPFVANTVRLTSDPRFDKWLVGADASRVYMNVYPTAFGQVPVAGGNITIIPIDIVQKLRPYNSFPFGRLSPNGSSFLVEGHRDPTDQQSEIWEIGSSGTPVQFITRAWSAGWSATGREVIYSTPRREIFTIPSAGGDPHLIRTLDGPLYPSGFEFSPDGSRVRFNWGDRKFMEMSADGSNLHEILTSWHPDDVKCCGIWTPDGDFYLFLSANSSERRGIPAFQLWALDERHAWLRKAAPGPIQLTFGPMTWETPVASRDGRQVFIKGNDIRGELVRYNRETRQMEPFLGGISADMLDFSRDGKYVVYASFPGDVLWKAARDGTGVQAIVKGMAHPTSPRWSPDGSQIAFVDYPPNGPAEVFIVPSKGGGPVRVLPGDHCCEELDPTWSPDGKRLAIWVAASDGKIEKELTIVDLETHQVSYLPRPPKRTAIPRWSPDGRYIVCETGPYPETDGLEVYDFKTLTWKILLTETKGWPPVSWPSWSKDSRWIYYMGPDDPQKFHGVVFRISVNGGTPERIADLPGFRPAGWLYNWFGIDPDDDPIMLRDAGANEIYALTIKR